jgi:prolyl 3-hydroxylase /prolyl 3,4-dihydroxylase
MAPHEGEDDPAIYRSGVHRTDASIAGGQPVGPNGSTDGHDETSKPPGDKPTSDHNAKSGNSEKHEDETMSIDSDSGNEEDEDDGTLLTVQPGFNKLLMVLRDEGVLKFVKYVSAAAHGSRWDICGEFEVGAVEEDSD